MFITADTIPIFSTAIIRDVTNSPLKINLMELGFLPGKMITLCHSAPMGGPLAFKLEETILALRKTEASLIQVEIL